MQAQAIINKLKRESDSLRETLIKKARESYKPSKEAQRIIALIKERDEHRAIADKAMEELNTLTKSIGVNTIYAYTCGEEIINRVKTIEVDDKFPRVDLDAALDDLIIASVEDDFNIDTFIESYLKQLRINE